MEVIALELFGISKSTHPYPRQMLSESTPERCARGAAQRDESYQSLEIMRANLKASLDAAIRTSAELEARRKTLDQSSQSAVAEFNVDVRRHNDVADAANREHDSFQNWVGAHNIITVQFNWSCRATKTAFTDDTVKAPKVAEATTAN